MSRNQPHRSHTSYNARHGMLVTEYTRKTANYHDSVIILGPEYPPNAYSQYPQSPGYIPPPPPPYSYGPMPLPDAMPMSHRSTTFPATHQGYPQIPVYKPYIYITWNQFINDQQTYWKHIRLQNPALYQMGQSQVR